MKRHHKGGIMLFGVTSWAMAFFTWIFVQEKEITLNDVTVFGGIVVFLVAVLNKIKVE